MANSDVVNLVVAAVTEMFTYMLPVIAFMSGVVFMVSWLMYITVGIGGRVFKG